MARKKQLIDKKIKKLTDKKCYFCGLDDYCQLDVHRILEGEFGGKYIEHNCIVTCVGCHRRIHAGKLKPIRKYYSTSGKWILQYLDENGEEKWL